MSNAKFGLKQWAGALWMPAAVLGLLVYSTGMPTRLLTSLAYAVMSVAADHGALAAFALGLAVCAGFVLCAGLVVILARGLVEYTYGSPPLWRGGFERATPAAQGFTSAYAGDRGYVPQARRTGSPARYAAAGAGLAGGAAAGAAWGGWDDMSDPLNTMNPMNPMNPMNQMSQLHETPSPYPDVNTNGQPMQPGGSGLDVTNHQYGDTSAVFEPAPSYDYSSNYDCGSSCGGGGFDF